MLAFLKVFTWDRRCSIILSACRVSDGFAGPSKHLHGIEGGASKCPLVERPTCLSSIAHRQN
jgi:hypothetical protein